MMNKKIKAITMSALVVMAMSVFPYIAGAQESQYRYADATQLWRLTDNAAGLALDSSANRGYVEMTGEHREGNYHRVQEGGQRNQFSFFTERYQTVGKYLVGYGRLRFDMNRTKERAWCDEMRPYNANPFITGSSISGKYDLQDFDFTAALGTVQMLGWTAGLRLDYRVADLSRLRDPRSRSQLLDYKLSPSLTYTVDGHTLGIDGNYHRRKEKIPSITTVQNDPNIVYYLMSGMEEANGSVGAYKGFSRQWVDHRFGANLTYGFQRHDSKSINTIGIERGSEDVLENEYREPGHYYAYRYLLSSRNRIKSNDMLHTLDLEMQFEQAYADEYKQQRAQTKDAQTGLTSYHYETLITYKKRYQVKRLTGSFHYRCAATDQEGINRYVGVSFNLNDTKNRHLLPQSDLHYDHFDMQAEAGTSLLGHRLWIDLQAGYHLSENAELSLADTETPYAQQVLLPDMAWYEANYWRGQLSLKYLVPLNFKGYRQTWYVKAFADGLRTNNDLKQTTVGLCIGLYN